MGCTVHYMPNNPKKNCIQNLDFICDVSLKQIFESLPYLDKTTQSNGRMLSQNFMWNCFGFQQKLYYFRIVGIRIKEQMIVTQILLWKKKRWYDLHTQQKNKTVLLSLSGTNENLKRQGSQEILSNLRYLWYSYSETNLLNYL